MGIGGFPCRAAPVKEKHALQRASAAKRLNFLSPPPMKMSGVASGQLGEQPGLQRVSQRVGLVAEAVVPSEVAEVAEVSVNKLSNNQK
jgi:hypothetical protein